ncbi:MAG TPA: hypothetical protein VFH73_02130 [Polyangia bacterium]|jgi:hypothetical protein|nr:hypothetical protein [Polyangia bacterium]
MPKGPSNIRDIVSQFVIRLSDLIEQDAVSRAREAVISAFGGGALGKRGPGRPPGSGAGAGRPNGHLLLSGRKRRKAPIQLCPVPGCTDRAAPVFGMVCSKHKDLPKAEIKKFREARRAKKSAKHTKSKPGTSGKSKTA